MRPGPATRAAFVRGFLLGGMTASARHDSARRSAAFAKARCRIRDLAITYLQPPRMASDLSCSEEHDGGGGRNARATSPRLRALSGVPPAIHPRESPAAAGSAAIIRKPRNSHVSLQPLSARSSFVATQKESALVKKLWRMSFPCGRRRKTKS